MAVAAIGYLQWTKGHDGSVKSSEATDLWDHFNAFQDRQEKALERSLGVEDELRKKISSLEAEQTLMRHSLDEKNDQIVEMRTEIVSLRKAREDMELDLAENADKISALTARIASLEHERDALIIERDALLARLAATLTENVHP